MVKIYKTTIENLHCTSKISSGSPFGKAADAIRSITEWDQNNKKVLKEQGVPEDPWLILRTLQTIISQDELFGENNQPILPLIKCDCSAKKPNFLRRT